MEEDMTDETMHRKQTQLFQAKVDVFLLLTASTTSDRTTCATLFKAVIAARA
jgi:hypothetical protein